VNNDDCKKPNGVLTPFLAFFSQDLYAGVATQWKGSGLLYLFFVVAFAWTVTCLAVAYSVNVAVQDKTLQGIVKQLPLMDFTGGRLSIDKPLPYRIIDPSSHIVMVEFVKEHPMTVSDTEAPIIVTQDYVLAKDQKEPINLADINSAYPGLKFSGADLAQLLDGAAATFTVILFVVGVLPVFIGHIFALLIYALLQSGFISMLGNKVEYSTAMRLAAVAMTPSILIASVLMALSPMVPAINILFKYMSLPWTAISIVLTTGFLYLAAKGVANAKIGQPATGELR
jgi:hypothetical protein